jgi:hypothetical protein
VKSMIERTCQRAPAHRVHHLPIPTLWPVCVKEEGAFVGILRILIFLLLDFIVLRNVHRPAATR